MGGLRPGIALMFAALVAAGCADDEGGFAAPDAGTGGNADAGVGPDASALPDAASTPDASVLPDADLPDAGGSANAPPLLSGEPGFALVDAAFAFTPDAADPDGDALSFTGANIPAWLTLDAASGTLSGTPSAGDIAVYRDVVITASDGELSTSLTVEIVVEVSALEAAIRSGDHRHVTDRSVYLDAVRQAIADGIAAGSLPASATALSDFFDDLETDGFTFDLGPCSEVSCPSGSTYNGEFRNPVNTLRSTIVAIEQTGLDIFEDETGYRYEKLLVLLADHYRSHAYYPINRVTNRLDFLEQMFADHIVYVPRRRNPAQPDMGNFSRSDFSHVTPASASVTLTSRPPFRATGVYALPGQTVVVTRTDDADAVTTRIGVGTVRPGAVRYFNNGGYNRPIFTTTTWQTVAPGESIYLTSPYGGPIQVGFDAVGADVSLSFDNVGRHPFWNGPEDTAELIAALEANAYDWAEFVTPDFEIHTPRSKMYFTLGGVPDFRAPTADAVATLYDDIVNIFIAHPYELAAYAGDRIPIESEIHDFATTHGLALEPVDVVQHVNADQPACPSTACGGNPYDTSSPFNPHSQTIHLHELGHSLEPLRLPLGWDRHSHTDLYYQYTAYRLRQMGITDVLAAGCRTIGHRAIFDIVQASRTEPDPFAYMQTQGMNDWRKAIALNMQLMALAEHAGPLTNGWYMLSQRQIIEREYETAIASDAAWASKASGLGFSGFSRAEAMALDNNDWHLIVLSHVLQLDLTDYLTVWGLPLGDDAKTYVASLGLPAAPLTFYAMNDDQQCDTGVSSVTPVAIDGTSPWPL